MSTADRTWTAGTRAGTSPGSAARLREGERVPWVPQARGRCRDPPASRPERGRVTPRVAVHPPPDRLHPLRDAHRARVRVALRRALRAPVVFSHLCDALRMALALKVLIVIDHANPPLDFGLDLTIWPYRVRKRRDLRAPIEKLVCETLWLIFSHYFERRRGVLAPMSSIRAASHPMASRAIHLLSADIRRSSRGTTKGDPLGSPSHEAAMCLKA